MSFKTLFRTIVFLAVLFVVLYVGMNNTQTIDFSFPIALTKKATAPAGLIYFAVFAVGVLAGMVLTAGSGGGGKGKSAGSSGRGGGK